jgi:hypothetical protein
MSAIGTIRKLAEYDRLSCYSADSPKRTYQKSICKGYEVVSMAINIGALVTVFFAFVIAFLFSKAGPKELIRMLGFYTLAGLGTVGISILWGGDLRELLTLQAVGKGGVAVSIIYGCMLGTLTSALIAVGQGRMAR